MKAKSESLAPFSDKIVGLVEAFDFDGITELAALLEKNASE